jgi:uncharacterized protein YjbJ (UPF0337 family)
MASNMTNAPVWDKIAGSWKEFKGNVRKEWGKLTDDDLEQIKGSRDVLVGRIQQRYGWAREEAERQIDAWADRQRF